MNGGNHDLHSLSTYPFQMFENGWDSLREVLNGVSLKIPVHLPLKGDTKIGNDVWLGLSATILPGVSIGDGSIVGAQAVVTHDVPPYTIVAGNPAKVIRRRFDDKTISKLEKIAWWNWSIKNINEVMKYIVRGDVNNLWRYAVDNKLAIVS
nr:CatB-related O-acetyltransferase [Zymobacter palmae]